MDNDFRGLIPPFSLSKKYQYGVQPTMVRYTVNGVESIFSLKNTPNTQALETRTAPSYALNNQWFDVSREWVSLFLKSLDGAGDATKPYLKQAVAQDGTISFLWGSRDTSTQDPTFTATAISSTEILLTWS